MKKIYRPVKTNLISQGFGLANTKPSLIPLYNSLGLKAHDGVDFAVKCKDNNIKTGGQCENVYQNVVDELTVTFIQRDIDKGFGISAIGTDSTHYLWWHEDSFDSVVFVGQKLKFGALIGVAGNTGMSTGAHVHFAQYLYGDNYNNGYHGASEPIIDNRFCLDIKSQIDVIQKLIEAITALVNLIK